MKRSLPALRVAALLFAAGAATVSAKPAATALRQVAAIVLPGTQGRIDHFNVDVPGRRLVIAALGNHSAEVVDLAAGRWVRSLPDISKPQGVWYVAGLQRLFIADGDAGDVRVYRGSDLAPLATIPLDLGPDAEAYDSATERLYVGYGGEDAGKTYGQVGVIDAPSDRHVGDIRTSAHPGGILVARPGRTLFITVPKTQQVAQIDTRTDRIVASWKARAGSPVSLALDRARHRLFVGTRNPAEVQVYDARSHRWIASLPSVGIMDGLYYDSRHRRIYASGGEGYVAVYRQWSADRYDRLGDVATGPNARTSLWVPQLNRYYVAVPAGGGHGAEVLEYQP